MKNLSIIAVLLLITTVSFGQKKGYKYHKFEITILDATTAETQNKYIKKINDAFNSKHCSYNSTKATFTLYTRNYFSKEGLRDYLANMEVNASGNIIYRAPQAKAVLNPNSNNN